jgi:hypothetical protein
VSAPPGLDLRRGFVLARLVAAIFAR